MRSKVKEPQGSDREMIDGLLLETLEYFKREANQKNGLISDSTEPGSPANIAATGLGLSAYVIAVDRGLMTRPDAIRRVLASLRFFWTSKQNAGEKATGYKGFYYHFLNRKTGLRAPKSELSTIDTALLLGGMLTAAEFFDRDNDNENEIRRLANEIYLRVDWHWAMNRGKTISHGWKPRSGFLHGRWSTGYSEAHILYILALGSPTHPVPESAYRNWIRTFEIKKTKKTKWIYAGPLFIHQMSQMWIDFRGIHDAVNQKVGFDYFENSRRATHAQRDYAIENPHGFKGYGKNSWGITASVGPGPKRLTIDGVEREFYGYAARGAPFSLDDGTISPWAVVASLPFAPRITLSTIRHAIERLNLKSKKRDPGFDASFNATFPEKSHNEAGWVAPWRLGLNQGPIILMIANHQTEFIWDLMKENPHITEGLRRAGFKIV